MAQFDLGADQLISLFSFVGIEYAGFNGLSTGRHLIHDAQIKIAIDSESQGARDGGGSHYQQVQIFAFGAQVGALGNTKAVLLVDDGKMELLELHGVFQKGMRADDNFDRSVFKALADFLLFCFGCVTNQQANFSRLDEIGEKLCDFFGNVALRGSRWVP